MQRLSIYYGPIYYGPMRPTPVAPGLPSTLPNGSFCSTFDLGPCFPQFLPPLGEDLRLTIVSTDDDGQRNELGAADQRADNPDGPADEVATAMVAAQTRPPRRMQPQPRYR